LPGLSAFTPETNPQKTAKITIFARMNRGRYLMDGMHPFVQLLLIFFLISLLLPLFSLAGMYLVRPLFGVTTIDVVMDTAVKNRQLVASHPQRGQCS
jgi:hypothetical protein